MLPELDCDISDEYERREDPTSPPPRQLSWSRAGRRPCHHRGVPGAPPGGAASREWDAASYHRVSAPQYSWGERVLDGLDLRGDETAVDIGCGTGRLTAALLERLPRGSVLAIDRSTAMAATARSHLAGRGRAAVVVADALDLPVVDHADLVFSTATFHWVLDHERLFSGIHRALRPGGRLVAQCGGGPNLARIHARADALLAGAPFAAAALPWTRPWEFADAATTAARLHAAGFEEVDTEVVEAPTALPGRAEYAEFLRTVVLRPYLATLPDAPLGEAFVSRMADAGAGDDPPWSLDYWRLNLRARRP